MTALGILWSLAVILGLAALVRYEGRTGISAVAPLAWPDDCALELEDGKPTLLLFAHPQCPCTRATIGELDRIMSRCTTRLHAVVVLLTLPELGEAWSRGEVRDAAARIPGVELREDPRGALARRFGAETSGQVLLYGADRQLAFQGGITGSRGHSGDNAGADSVVALVLGREPPCKSTPVYGCRLFHGSTPRDTSP